MIKPPKEMQNNPRFRITTEADGTRTYIADPDGSLHAPVSAEKGTIAKLDVIFCDHAAANDLCSGCGKRLGNLARIYLSRTGEEPPLHPLCAFYTLQVYPHLRKWRCDRIIVLSEENVSSKGNPFGQFIPKMFSPRLSYDEFVFVLPEILKLDAKQSVAYAKAHIDTLARA
jgi:hypothetical protein